MTPDPGLFETIHATRAMRRLKPDAIPDALLETILTAGACAPSGNNLQPWAFVILRSAAPKRFFSDRYLSAMRKRVSRLRAKPDNGSPHSRMLGAAWYLAERIHEAPIILLVCGQRDWPFGTPPARRIGKAPPSYASTFPCVQNILLACRGLGLGASLTTLHTTFEEELCHYLGIPDDHGIVAAIPIGYPLGKFGPVRRRPIGPVTHYDSWGRGSTKTGSVPNPTKPES